MKLTESKLVENIFCDKVTSKEVPEIMNTIVPEIIKLIEKYTTDSCVCMGLAAPQVGINKKFFVKANYSNKDNPVYEVYFNAQYFRNGNRAKSREGCFSYNEGKDIAEVKRYKRITMKYENWNGKELVSKRKNIHGFDSFVFQHEIDHIGNGENIKSKTIFMKG